MLDAINHN